MAKANLTSGNIEIAKKIRFSAMGLLFFKGCKY